MQTSADFISKVNLLVGQGYWLGTFGQIATEQLWNENKARLPSWYNAHTNAKTLWMGKKVVDCAGVDKFARWLQADGSVKYDSSTDLNEQMLYDKSKALGKKNGAIETIPATPGLIVWKSGHMGVYRGNGEVVESRGGDYGVVVTKVFERGWTNWFEEPFLDYGTGKMLKRGDLNADVGVWQEILNSKGYGLDVDNDFGPATETATNQHKGIVGLPKNGIVDFDTLLVSYSASVKDSQSKLEQARFNAQKLNDRIDSLTNENGMLEGDVRELDQRIATLVKKIESDKFKIDTIDQRERDHKEIVDNLNQQIAELQSVKH